MRKINDFLVRMIRCFIMLVISEVILAKVIERVKLEELK
jgi:hypothetical protein